MYTTSDKYIDILIGLEPVFKKAGQLALELRKTAKISDKFQSGISMLDMVTDADLAVQEVILTEMAKTKLRECKIVAEENTPSVLKFKGVNDLTITIDPIDGTFIYTSSGRFFSVIICLNDGKSLLYTYVYYPVVDWARRITKNKVEDFGTLPQAKIKNGLNLSRTIAYSKKPPENEIFDGLVKDGYTFRSMSEITDEAGSCTLLFLNQVAGYYTHDPGAYDALCALHYGQAKNFTVNSTVDLSKLITGPYNQYYPGWYYVLKK